MKEGGEMVLDKLKKQPVKQDIGTEAGKFGEEMSKRLTPYSNRKVKGGRE